MENQKNPDIIEAEKIFSRDKFATDQTEIKIQKITEETVQCGLTIQDKHRNAMGGVMGGVFFTLADFVFAIATNYKKVPTVSTSAQINFLGQPKGTQLFGESVCIKDGKSTCLYEVKITDELGTKVALAVINGMKLGK